MTKHIEISVEALDTFMEGQRALADGDFQAWHAFVMDHKFLPPQPVPDEADRQAFLEYQLNLWKLVSGRDTYVAEICEANDYISEAPNIQAAYPFSSGNCAEVGNYFGGLSNIIRNLDLPRGASIAEFGVGFAHLTRTLSSMGFDVTAVDIEARFLGNIAPLSLPGAAPVKTMHSSFEAARFPDGSLDAAIFFECFHHSLEHEKLIRNLAVALKPAGKILFAAEAFYDEWFDFPWGIRLDGHSVRAIREFGWMELGFRKSYITNLLTEYGFSLNWSQMPELGAYGELLIATRQTITD